MLSRDTIVLIRLNCYFQKINFFFSLVQWLLVYYFIVSISCNVCHKMCAKSMFSNEGIIVTKGYNTKMPFDQHITNYIIFRHGIKNCVSSVFLVTVLPQRKLKYIPHLTKQCLFTWLAERWIRNPIYKPRLLTTSCMKNNRVTNIWQCKT